MPDRAQLEAWIADTERNRRRLRTAMLPSAVVALGLLVWSRPVGAPAIATLALTTIFGFWIMASHIADWSTKLDELDRPRPVGRAIKRR